MPLFFTIESFLFQCSENIFLIPKVPKDRRLVDCIFDRFYSAIQEFIILGKCHRVFSKNYTFLPHADLTSFFTLSYLEFTTNRYLPGFFSILFLSLSTLVSSFLFLSWLTLLLSIGDVHLPWLFICAVLRIC